MENERKLLLLGASIGAALIVLEVGLRAFTVFPIHASEANRRIHPELGYVMAPALAGIDLDGFRNPSVLTKAELVAIGDSYTYGFNVESEASWPAQLAALTGSPVYNYGVGGYGFLHYSQLFSRALSKSPRVILLGLYLANDLGDICESARHNFWKKKLVAMGLGWLNCPAGKAVGDAAERHWRRRGGFWTRTATGSAFQTLFWQERSQRSNSKLFLPVKYGSRTTLLSKLRVVFHQRHTAPESKSVKATVFAAEALLDQMIAAAGRSGVRVAALFIPSKENVLLEFADPSDPFTPIWTSAVNQERELIDRFDRFLRDRGVRTARPDACLQSRLDRKLYLGSANVHPLEVGYECYAESAEQLVGPS